MQDNWRGQSTTLFTGLVRYKFIRLTVVTSEICEIQKNSLKIQTYRVQGHPRSSIFDLGVNRKRICNFLLVINSNFGRISYSFRDIDTFSYKIACFPTTPLFKATSGGTPCTINIIYTSLKSTFSGLQFCSRHYGFIFIHLATVAFQICEITRNSDKIWPYSNSRSSKVIDLSVNQKLICDLVIVVTLALSATVFEILMLKARKWLNLACLRRPLGGNPLECRDEIWHQKTRIVGLPDSEEIMTLAFFVLTDTLLSQRPALA